MTGAVFCSYQSLNQDLKVIVRKAQALILCHQSINKFAVMNQSINTFEVIDNRTKKWKKSSENFSEKRWLFMQ